MRRHGLTVDADIGDNVAFGGSTKKKSGLVALTHSAAVGTETAKTGLTIITS
jgi:hypothetical protein